MWRVCPTQTELWYGGPSQNIHSFTHTYKASPAAQSLLGWTHVPPPDLFIHLALHRQFLSAYFKTDKRKKKGKKIPELPET